MIELREVLEKSLNIRIQDVGYCQISSTFEFSLQHSNSVIQKNTVGKIYNLNKPKMIISVTILKLSISISGRGFE